MQNILSLVFEHFQNIILIGTRIVFSKTLGICSMTCNTACAFVPGSSVCCPWVPARTHREAFQTPLECIPCMHSDLWKVMLLKKMEGGVTTSYILTVTGLFPTTEPLGASMKINVSHAVGHCYRECWSYIHSLAITWSDIEEFTVCEQSICFSD